jgi:hypothetical protein
LIRCVAHGRGDLLPVGWLVLRTCDGCSNTRVTFATGTGVDAEMAVAADPREPIGREDFGRKGAGERRVDVAAKGLGA